MQDHRFMDPQKLAQLDPKLREVYLRIMNQTLPPIPPKTDIPMQTPKPKPITQNPTTVSISQPEQKQETQKTINLSRPQPIVDQQVSPPAKPIIDSFQENPQQKSFQPAVPKQPSSPFLKPDTGSLQENLQLESSQVSKPIATPNNNRTIPYQTPKAQHVATGGEESGIISFIFGVFWLLFFIAYTFFWIKFFNYKLPSLT